MDAPRPSELRPRAVLARMALGALAASTAGLAYGGAFGRGLPLRVGGACALAAALAWAARLAQPARSLAATAAIASALGAPAAGAVLAFGDPWDDTGAAVVAGLLGMALALLVAALARPAGERPAPPLDRRLLQAARGAAVFLGMIGLGSIAATVAMLLHGGARSDVGPLGAAVVMAHLGAGAALGLDYAGRAPEGLALSRFDTLTTAEGRAKGAALAPLWARLLLGAAAGFAGARAALDLPLGGADAQAALAIAVGLLGACIAVERDRPRPRPGAIAATAVPAALAALGVRLLFGSPGDRGVALVFAALAAAWAGAAPRAGLAWREEGGAPRARGGAALAVIAGTIRGAVGVAGATGVGMLLAEATLWRLVDRREMALLSLGASLGAAAVAGWTWAEVSARAKRRGRAA